MLGNFFKYWILAAIFVFSGNIYGLTDKAGVLDYQASVREGTQLYISKDFSRWLLVSDSLQSDIGRNENNKFQIYKNAKTNILAIGYGFSQKEFSIEVEKTLNKTSLFYLWIHKSYAEECSEIQRLASSDLIKTKTWSEKISVENILSACEWNPAEIASHAINKLIDSAKGLLTLDILEKINQIFVTIKNFVSEFADKILPGLSKLAESAPDLVNTWSCEKLRNHAPLLAASVFMPQMAARQLPMTIAEILNDLQFLVSKPIGKLIKNISDVGKLDPKMTGVLARLSKERPRVFDDIKINNDNFVIHAKKHEREFASSLSNSNGEIADYAARVKSFANKSDTHDVFFVQGDTVAKFNSKNGKMLVVDEHGKFVTFYQINGATEEDRLWNFIMKQTAKQERRLSN